MHRLRRSLSRLLSFVLALCVLSPLGGAALAAEDPTPYAEEHGFTFVNETSLTAPVFFYLEKDGEYLPNSSVASIEPLGDARFTISDLSLSAPDENGLVELRLTVTMDAASLFTSDSGIGSFYIRYSTFSFFDYYSGYTVPNGEQYGKSSSRSYSAEFACNGETIPVIETKSWTGGYESGLSSWSKYRQLQKEADWYLVSEYTFTFPAAYDGLCLALSKAGITEYSEDWASEEEKVHESEPFLDSLADGRTQDDYYLLRVSDLLQQA